MGNRANWNTPPEPPINPDFGNLLKVLQLKKPDRPTLFEFFLNIPLYERLTGLSDQQSTAYEEAVLWVKAFAAAGYDYATVSATNLNTLSFAAGYKDQLATVSLNAGSVIHDRETFESYEW